MEEFILEAKAGDKKVRILLKVERDGFIKPARVITTLTALKRLLIFISNNSKISFALYNCDGLVCDDKPKVVYHGSGEGGA